MKKFIVLVICAVCLLMANQAKAQSEVYAGGEIYVEYVGDYTETCGQPLPYEITMRFFRDDPGVMADPLPAMKSIFLIEKMDKELPDGNANHQTIQLALDEVIPTIELPCIRNSPIQTDGGYYRANVNLNANRFYTLVYSTAIPGTNRYNIGVNFQSPENGNFDGGQTFAIVTRNVNTECGVIITGPDDTPPNEEVSYNLGFNKGATWSSREIVETICELTPYEYDLHQLVNDEDVITYDIIDTVTGNVKDQIVNRDDNNLSFALAAVPRGFPGAVTYAFPRGPFDPFPTTSDNPFTLNETTGVLTFTAELPPGQTYYTSTFVIDVIERRFKFELTEPAADGSRRRIYVGEELVRTRRQLRFIIGDEKLCNKRIPEFTSDLFNPVEGPEGSWEFNCASKFLEFDLTEPALANSLDRLDFRIFRGNTPSTVDDNAYAIDDIVPGIVDDMGNFLPDETNFLGEFTRMRVELYQPIGPGNYIMFARRGADGNTLKNRCGFFLPGPDSVTIPIYIEDGEFDYVFKQDSRPTTFDDPTTIGSQVDFCYTPGKDENEDFNLDALLNQSAGVIMRADSFVFKYRNSSPSAPPQLTFIQVGKNRDSAEFNTLPTLTVPDPYDFPNTPLTDKKEGFWTVGVGLNYDYTYNDTRFAARCYNEDATFVRYFEHPEVKRLDIDLCGDEDWPIVRDLIDPQYLQPGNQYRPLNFSWFLEDPSFMPDGLRPVGGQTTFGGELNDTLDLNGIAFGVGQRFNIQSVVFFPAGGMAVCPDSGTITVIKQDVKVDIGRDSIICKNQSYLLENTGEDTYLRPDSMSHEWFYKSGDASNYELIVGADSQSVMIDGGGWYKLEVTKRTEQGMCFGEDSVLITVADSLTRAEPICQQVTFTEGVVQQRFVWPVVDGADDYQVRGIDEFGNPLDSLGNPTPNGEIVWYLPNDDFGLHHKINGAQVQLAVRPVNYEVEEDATCRFGEEGIAEACEIIVKPVNIFTPNGDGINDLLRFDLIEIYPGSKLQIFNRWGKLLYENDNYLNDWDGEDYKDGTYFYVLDINDPKGIQDIFKGTFTILR